MDSSIGGKDIATAEQQLNRAVCHARVKSALDNVEGSATISELEALDCFCASRLNFTCFNQLYASTINVVMALTQRLQSYNLSCKQARLCSDPTSHWHADTCPDVDGRAASGEPQYHNFWHKYFDRNGAP